MLRLLHLMVLSVLIFAGLASIPASANVTIQGTVEYYDSIRGGYRPAKQVLVEVEGDWWDFNPQVYTNDSGFYKATQRDPWIGNFDINIVAYAQAKDILNIYENMFFTIFPFWGYHVASQTTYDINGGQTCTINLKIGGSYNSVKDTWCRSIAENANAFLLEQEGFDYYNKLIGKGFPRNAFNGTKIIAAAAGVTSYYNHFTDYINLTYGSLTGKPGFNAGFDDWSKLDNSTDGLTSYSYVLDMVRHESSHRIHNRLAVGAPLGLNIPTTHSPLIATNQFVAFTEGFAEFLPLTTYGNGGMYEPTPSSFSTNPINLPAAVSPDDNNEYEGEVAGLLLDIYDPANTTEQMRYPAKKNVGGKDVPKDLQAAQKWMDRLADVNCTKIRAVVAKAINVVGPVDQISAFLDEYDKAYPADRHAIKTIAQNRCLASPLLLERPPYLETGIGIGRQDNSYVGLKLDLVELDQEDRNFVTVYIWRDNAGTASQVIAPVVCSSGWVDSKKTLTLTVPLTPATGTNDWLWIVVSDEMRAVAYRVEVPAKVEDTTVDPGTTDDSSSGSGSGKQPWDRKLIPVPKPSIGIDNTRITKSIKGEISAQTIQRITSSDQLKNVTEFQTAMKEVGVELASYAQAQRTLEKASRILRGVAKNADSKSFNSTTRLNANRLGSRNLETSFSGWLTEVSAGRTLKTALPATAKSAAAAQLKSIQDALKLRQTASTRANQLAEKLQNAYDALSFTQEAPQAQSNTKLAVDAMKKNLTDFASDQMLNDDLDLCGSAMEALTRGAQQAPTGNKARAARAVSR